MAARKLPDRQAGALPVIRAERDSVIFHLEIARISKSGRLVIRCDAEGNVWAAIDGARTANEWTSEV